MEVCMQELVTSLKNYSLTKDIKEKLNSINPTINQNDLSKVLYQFYKEELIGEAEFVTMETKALMNQFCFLMERKFPELACGVYLFDKEENKLWNGAVPNIPRGYSEYSNGITVKGDIEDGEEIPVYIKGILAVSDVDRAEDITSLNHKKDIMKNSLHAYCASPLSYNGHPIGHTVMFSTNKRVFSEAELNQFSLYNRFIEERLYQKKKQLLKFIKESITA
jgi:hypothetical protein